MGFERDAGLARADLDVDRDIGGHVIMRQAHDLRRRGALAADAAVGDPVFGRDDALGDEHRFGLFAEAMQVLDGEVVGEDCFFVGAMQPMRALAFGAVPEIAEARLGEDGMARAEGDELARRQPAVPRERFEDVADVGVGDLDVLARHSAREVRAALVSGLRAAYARK